MTQNSFWDFLLIISLIYVGKFFVFYCVPYLILWKYFPHKFLNSKIQKIERVPPNAGYEFKFSLITIVMQSFFITFLFWGSQQGLFKLFPEFGEKGIAFEVIGFFAYFLIYDTYFYWSHRFLHWGWFYKSVHIVHHRSMNPTPLASFSFHPIETIITTLYMIPFVLVFPVSYSTFCVLLILTDFGNVAGHLGHEVIPKRLHDSKFGSWITTPTHHNMHHQYSKFNFGLYWNGWDIYFKTQHSRTREEFDRVKNQKDSVSTSA